MESLEKTKELLRVTDQAYDHYKNFVLIDSLELIDRLEPYLTQLTEDDLLNKGYKKIHVDHSYNWGAPLTHDFNICIYQNMENTFIENTFLVIKWHIAGDMRCNYTDELVYLCESWDWAWWLSEIWEELESSRKWFLIPETKWRAYIDLEPLTELKYIYLQNEENENIITYDSYESNLDWIIKEAREKIEEEEKEKNEG